MDSVADKRIALNYPRCLIEPARRLLFRKAPHLRYGRIEIEEGGRRHAFGAVSAAHPEPATLIVHDPACYADMLLGGVVGAAESFIAGRWSTDDLPRLLRIVMHNESLYVGLGRGLGALLQPVRDLMHAFRRNSKHGSRKNIMAHYDLGNDFFALFLDPTMAYSSAYFPTPDTALAEASRAKFDRLCHLLDLRNTDHLLEIGTGWGGFAMHAAQRYGCRVTTTTISPAQRDWVNGRIRDVGLQDQVTVLDRDYRKLEGRYDKLVSIEMIEAVGHHYLDSFFACCSSLLKADGLMALQAITVPNRRYALHKRRSTFINEYVFPGSCLHSDAAMLGSLARTGDLELMVKDDLTAHYVKTLAIWRANFMAQLNHIRKEWPSEAFIRTWDMYLASCEAGFAERSISVGQYLFAKPKAPARLTYAT